MNKKSYTIYTLKPSWSRILDRIHTVGSIKQTHANSLASLVEQGNYPKLVTTSREDKSFSLDGSNSWLTQNWERGWVVVSDHLKQAKFYFSGSDGRTFHHISLTPQSHWDCFECLLQMFSAEVAQAKAAPRFDQLINKNVLNPHVVEMAKRVNREIIRGVELRCVISTAGGVIKRVHDAGGLMTKFGAMSLCASNSKLTLNTSAVEEVEIVGKKYDFKGTIYDAEGVPRVTIEAA